MSEDILMVENLTKEYKNIKALDNVNISLERGKIYGIIGENGAGKTTLIRMIAGLGEPTYGEIILFGHKEKEELKNQRKRIGYLIETPSLYLDMTAKDNMKLHRTIKGIPDMEMDEEILKLVGLESVYNKKAKDFSLGMKQRLGIAIALIGNPELLILDEPINGIDPSGIVEIRQLLRKLSEEKNITILISSHILNELYQLATNYIFIHKGRIKENITLKEIDEKCKKYILLNTDEPERMVYILENVLNTRNYKVMPDKSIRLYEYIDNRKELAKAFLENRILVTKISCESDSLEDYFMNVVGGKNV